LISWQTDATSRPKGPHKNNFTFKAPIHPTQRRCENTQYARYYLIFAPC
jgi:hypothetical protein